MRIIEKDGVATQTLVCVECGDGFAAPIAPRVDEFSNAQRYGWLIDLGGLAHCPACQTTPMTDEFEQARQEGYDHATVDRFLQLAWRLARAGALSGEVVDLANKIVSSVECAVDFPTLKWDGATYLVKQDQPMNCEAL